MQVEAGVKHVEPRPHALQILHRTGVNLHHGRARHEDHDRQPRLRRLLDGLAEAGRRHLFGKSGTNQPAGLHPVNIQIAQHVHEMMHVFQRFPPAAQFVHIHLVVRPTGGGGLWRLDTFTRLLPVGAMFRNQTLERSEVAVFAQMNLEYRRTGRIEELQAVPDSTVALIRDRIAMSPTREGQPQVNIGAKDQAAIFRYRDLFESSDLFVNGIFIARQGHDIAKPGHGLDHFCPTVIKAGHPLTASGRRQAPPR